jgi:hypothetical protein
MPNNYANDLLAAALKQYPFMRQYNPVVTTGKGPYYAETWPAQETGDASMPRPSDIPIDRNGVQVFQPNSFGPTDLAAEFLHIDPFANATRNQLLQSLTPQQTQTLQRESNDYGESLKAGQTQQKAMQNATDSAMRGYTVGQWPASANAQMRYSQEQLKMLIALQAYMKQGYYPLNYKLPKK